MRNPVQLMLFRLFQIIAPSVGLSAIICGCAAYIPNDIRFISVIVSLSALVFALLNTAGLRMTYLMSKDDRTYYIASFAAYGIYMVISAAVYLISKELYTWTFLPTKFLHFFFPAVKNWMSAGVLHIIMLALVPVVARIPVKEPNPSSEKKRGSINPMRLFYAAADKVGGSKDKEEDEYKFKRRRRAHLGSFIGDLIFSLGKGRKYDDNY